MNMQNKLYIIQFFSSPDDQFTASPQAATAELADFVELPQKNHPELTGKFELPKKEDPCPPANPHS